MNTDNNNTPTPSEIPPQFGQAISDSKPLTKYEVELRWTQYNIAKVIIEATSLAEAEEMAEEIESDEVDDWNPVSGEVYVESVEPFSVGKTHE